MIVVTGAAGMIGSAVVRHLNDLGKTNLVLVDDCKHTDKWKNLVGKQFVELLSRHALFGYLAEKGSSVSAIIHLGACSDTMETNADYLLENNYRYSIRLADWALSKNKRFVYASSAATYGDGSQGFSDQEEMLEELRPINIYAYSKHLVDLWMKQHNALSQAVGLKYFNVFGPNEYHKGRMASMLLKMTHVIQNEGHIALYKSNDPERYADGEQCRDFIYVKDAVRITCALIEPQYQHIAGIYNVGLGQATTWNALAHFAFQALEKKPSIGYVEMPAALHAQYQNYTCADVTKLHKSFQGLEMTSMEEAVREYVQKYLVKSERW